MLGRPIEADQHSEELFMPSIELVPLPPEELTFFCALVKRSNSAAASDLTAALSVKKNINIRVGIGTR